jgi:hypothetical protein
MEAERHHAHSHKLVRLANKLKDKLYRDSFVAARARRFLAHQVRAIRGAMSQSEFGKLIDKPQSVVSRLEDPSYGKMTINSLLDIAAKVDRALVIQFVDWKQFLKMTEDNSEAVSSPSPYNSDEIDAFSAHEAVLALIAQQQASLWVQLTSLTPGNFTINNLISPVGAQMHIGDILLVENRTWMERGSVLGTNRSEFEWMRQSPVNFPTNQQLEVQIAR